MRHLIMHLDSLEARRLLAASVTLVAGELKIQGTDAAENVTLSFDQKYRKSANRILANDMIVSVTGVKTRFDMSAIEAIDVELGGGNDQFFMGLTNNYWRRLEERDGIVQAVKADWTVYVDGGAGNDELAGTAGDETLIGGAGHDFLQSGGGTDLVIAGSGNDVIVDEGRGRDTLQGGDGDDIMFLVGNFKHTLPKSTRPAVNGGAGRDRLVTVYNAASTSASVEVREPAGRNIGVTLSTKRGWHVAPQS